jgi:ABC-type Mn2+/Zn2+ transport system ATPase subunit
MRNYELILKSEISDSFRCTKAANSLDIDQEKKSVHKFNISADIENDFNIGLIVGASGSGKTTFTKHAFGDDCFQELLDPKLPVIDQFPESFSYDDCAAALSGVGLTAVMCWIRPAVTLSNGQKARAEIALQMASDSSVIVIDEWTSVVDRTVAKVMSHCIQKHARKTSKKIILCSCHYDVIEWLSPDWVIDCNKQSYLDRRLERCSEERKEKLEFKIKRVGRETWPYFSKYHYLSERLPGGHIETFGLFHNDEQIGFQCFANYVPHRKGTIKQMHSNRTVIHPDYAGFGMGIKLINETSKIMHSEGFDVRAKFSSTPVYKAMSRQDCWKLDNINRKTKMLIGENAKRRSGFRTNVKTYSFKYIPNG